jgi:acetoin utilization deacetylase AcuC-like enzyme
MSLGTRIFFSSRCLEYGSQYHPENSARIEEAYGILRDHGYGFTEPEPAEEYALLKVHSKKYVDGLKDGEVKDLDTPNYEGIYEYGRIAAGGAIAASESNGFSLMRPPGHHVGKNGSALGASTRGFCYLNNIAVAVRHLGKSTLILDIDGHHGNGTQEIFQNKHGVIYVSLHRSYIYPGTGDRSTGNCLNYPISGDCGQEIYLQTLDEALSEAGKNDFERVAVSAGFDSHSGDLASLGLINESYYEIGRRIASLERPTFFVLEAGYSGRQLGSDIVSFLRGFELIKDARANIS